MAKNYKEMNNSEIKIEMKNLENQFEKTKLEVIELTNKLKELDKEYLSAKQELNNRSKGLW